MTNRFPLQQETTTGGTLLFCIIGILCRCYRFRYGFVVIVCFSTIVILTVVRILLFLIFSEESFEYWDCFFVELPGSWFRYMFQSGGNWRLRLSKRERECVCPFVVNSRVFFAFLAFASNESNWFLSSIIIGILNVHSKNNF